MIITNVDMINVTVQMSHVEALLVSETLARASDVSIAEAAHVVQKFHPMIGGEDSLIASTTFSRLMKRTITAVWAYYSSVTGKEPAVEPTEEPEIVAEVPKSRVN